MSPSVVKGSFDRTARRLRSLLAVSALALLAACGVGDDDDDDTLADDLEQVGVDEAALTPLPAEKNDAVTRNAWATLGLGVSHKSFSSGKNVLIVYGGYTAQDVYVQRWANELYRKRGTALDIGELYAVRGPNQSGYANREIQNSRIAAHLGANGAAGRAARASSIIVVAHSSGTYVADELFAMMRAGSGGVPAKTIEKVSLFNLDGGGVANPTTLRMMAGAWFVYACDATIGRCSHNASSMKARGAQYASLGGALLVNANGSGCSKTLNGGLWCLHDTLIINRPHNPAMYDLRNDYTNFTGSREVVTSYLDVLSN
ncbi:MAG: hypothetical protein KF795_22960 [Labilithrix sp.]|nr:hypothetical protein [Labilithrix sp.]